MKQKQNTIWHTCYSKGILDNSKGPFFSKKNSGSTVAEKVLRLTVFMIGVLAAAQLLNFIQTNYFTSDNQAVIFSNNLVRETISQGYVGSYLGQPLPGGIDSLAAAPIEENVAKVLAARTYRSNTAESVLAHPNTEQPSQYKAELVSQNYPNMTILAGRAFTFEVRFKNTGNAAWTNNGKHFVAFNVTDPASRHSSFQHVTWKEYYYRPARLKEAVVKPGETGTFRFALQAPAQAGQYTENFGLVAENLTWIQGGHVTLPIKVVLPPPAYRSELAGQSHEKINVSPGEIFSVWADFKNTGAKAWTNAGQNYVALNVTDPAGRRSPFIHESWTEFYYRPTRLAVAEVPPNWIGRFSFTLKAPLEPGEYTESFALVVENKTWIEGGRFVLPITVTKPIVDEQPNEPEIRVGLFAASEPVQITADAPFKVVDGKANLIGNLQAGEVVATTYAEEKYTLQFPTQTLISESYVRFVPQERTAVFEVKNYSNRPEWNTQLNDNRFRGEIEIHYAPATQKLWVINELPLEQYLRGVAEASNDDQPEYLKALIIAERTYAQYHINTGTKHVTENYTIDATYDQVYRGYNFELRSPNISKYVAETAGTMVGYNDEIVVTPYFSHSDGRTRAWEEVWSGGPYPWLISVPDPASAGLAMLGHGVGLSALGARQQAEEGRIFTEILAYFYTGTSVKKIY
ncbi:MAG: SpoIID/LytB domain-containing protein [Patescibacteria group bacterium]|nr:SpoIID/LytB domain-containing protein [Patescibacteria group bacterium]